MLGRISSSSSFFFLRSCTERIIQPILTDAVLTRQLPALNPETGSSTMTFVTSPCQEGYDTVAPRLSDIPAACRRRRRRPPEPEPMPMPADGRRRLTLIIRLSGFQGRLTYARRLGMRTTAPSPSSWLHY